MWLSSLLENIAALRSFRLCSIILCGLIFTGCSDVSIRQLGNKNLQLLQQIAVKDTTGRENQLYGRELRKLLNISSKTVENYELISSISTSTSTTLSVQGTSSTLKKMRMSAGFKLRSLVTSETLITDSITAEVTIGAVASLYGQDKSEIHARERLAILLAQRVVRRLQLYFLNQSQ